MSIREKIGGILKQYIMVIILVAILLIFQITTSGALLTSVNLFNLVNQNAYGMILAVGMLICVLTGGNVDLSVGSLLGFVSACMATFMTEYGMNTYLAIFLGLLIGILAGVWQGFWIAYVRVPSFITTLAGMLIFQGGILLVLKGGKTIAPLPESFNVLASGYIGTAEASGSICLAVGVMIALVFVFFQIKNYITRKRNGYSVNRIGSLLLSCIIVSAVLIWAFAKIAEQRGVPTVLILVGLVALIYYFVTQKTVIGRHLYALGGNAKAAKLSGIKTDRILFLAYVNMSLLAAVAAVAYSARMNAAAATAGTGTELDAIGAVFLGGASASGGIGTVGGTLIGALIMGVLNNGMSIMGLGTDMQQAVKGLVLLAAVAVDVISKQRTLDPIMNRIRLVFFNRL
ncbi:sugar ABC transporter permease [Clostridia bacterium]|nr:sugar ABC transporter permease [Clostridia bacterium]